MTTVIVTNIAPGTSEATITEFFSFCGRIVQFSVENGESQMTAHITFETPAAAKTSLLLTNALIADRPIQVQLDPNAPVIPSSPEQSLHSQPDQKQMEHEEDNAPLMEGGSQRIEPNTATHIIATIIAAGHKLSDSAVAEAKALDERLNFTTTVQTGLENIKGVFTDLGQKIGIDKATHNAYQSLSETAESTGIAATANSAVTATESFFGALARSASNALQSVASTSAAWAEANIGGAVETVRSASNAVEATATTIRSEAHQIYPGADALAPQEAVQEVAQPAELAVDEPAVVHAESTSAQ